MNFLYRIAQRTGLVAGVALKNVRRNCCPIEKQKLNNLQILNNIPMSKQKLNSIPNAEVNSESHDCHKPMLGAFFIFLCVLFSSCDSRNYDVKITYCDNRPPKIINVSCFSRPRNSDISTYKQAVPKYKDELNVCQIEVLP